MWVRNMRQTAISYMRAAGTDSVIAGRVAGNSAQMNDHYTEANDTFKRAAIASLGGKKTASRVLSRVLDQNRPSAIQ